MIKIKKENLIVLGLSYENLRRLKNDDPIKFNLKDLGMQDMAVIIFSGKTEEDMTNYILDIINSNKNGNRKT